MIENTGLPFGLWKGQISLIWPFLKQFSRNKMIWPFGLFLAFFNLEENSIFLSLFWLNFNKSYNTLWYFKNFMIYFSKFSLKIWPLLGLFHHLRIWPFLKLLMAKFGLFYFLGPGNPVRTQRESLWIILLTQIHSSSSSSKKNWPAIIKWSCHPCYFTLTDWREEMHVWTGSSGTLPTHCHLKCIWFVKRIIHSDQIKFKIVLPTYFQRKVLIK